jgi:Putative DNA-binding domain
MPTLLEIQRAVARSILSRDDGDALRHIVDDTIAAADRLGIYRNNSAATLVGALHLAYPAVEKLVGPEFFGGAARVFIAQHPPRTAYLNDYGAELADFLAAFPAAAGLKYLPDVARLEWAVGTALNGLDAPALEPAALAGLASSEHGRVRFVPHPSVRLLCVHYPADVIWRAVLGGDDAALAALELTVEPLLLVVHRGSEGIVVRRLTQEEADWTAMLFSGAALAQAMPQPESPAFVQLLADHLAQGRFAAFAMIEPDRAATSGNGD